MKFQAGDSVRFSGSFLRNTGQHAGSEGRKVFKVLSFERDWAIVDEKLEAGLEYFTSEEIAKQPDLAFRRIAVANLVKVGQPDGCC